MGEKFEEVEHNNIEDIDTKIYELVEDMKKYDEDWKQRKEEEDRKVRDIKIRIKQITEKNGRLLSYQKHFSEMDEEYKEYQKEIDENNNQIKELEKQRRILGVNHDLLEFNRMKRSAFFDRRDSIVQELKNQQRNIIRTRKNETEKQRRVCKTLESEMEALTRGIESEKIVAENTGKYEVLEYKMELLARKKEMYQTSQATLDYLENDMTQMDEQLERIDRKIEYLKRINTKDIDKISFPTIEKTASNKNENVTLDKQEGSHNIDEVKRQDELDKKVPIQEQSHMPTKGIKVERKETKYFSKELQNKTRANVTEGWFANIGKEIGNLLKSTPSILKIQTKPKAKEANHDNLGKKDTPRKRLEMQHFEIDHKGAIQRTAEKTVMTRKKAQKMGKNR